MDGIIVVNKPSGCTSFSIVNTIKRTFGFKKVGHAGTLDPFATGLLLILINKATKIFDLLVHADKHYSGTMLLGIETDTQDLTGKVTAKLETGNLKLEPGLLENIRNSFIGKINQVPPMVSALHHKGERLYKLARKGVTVPREPREVTIHEFNITSVKIPSIEFSVRCSKGTYIRTLCHDFGKKLGCGAHLYALCRDGIGPFMLDESYEMDTLVKMDTEKIIECIIPLEEAKRKLETVRF